MASQMVISLGMANRYLRGIRNKQKREYAEAYLNHLLGKSIEPQSDSYGIGYMAAQAVRLQLAEIFPD